METAAGGITRAAFIFNASRCVRDTGTQAVRCMYVTCLRMPRGSCVRHSLPKRLSDLLPNAESPHVQLATLFPTVQY